LKGKKAEKQPKIAIKRIDKEVESAQLVLRLRIVGTCNILKATATPGMFWLHK